MSKTKPIPDGYHTVTPHIIVRGMTEAIAFYQRAFGAETRLVVPGPDGKPMHGEVQIGSSHVMLAAENEQWGSKSPLLLGGTPVVLSLYVENCDASFDRAVKAGAKPIMPPTDMFWGDRYAQVSDPFGHTWSIATHTHDYTPEQIMENMRKQFADGKGCS